MPELVARLRGLDVEEITIRLDKAFWKKKIVRTLRELVGTALTSPAPLPSGRGSMLYIMN